MRNKEWEKQYKKIESQELRAYTKPLMDKHKEESQTLIPFNTKPTTLLIYPDAPPIGDKATWHQNPI